MDFNDENNPYPHELFERENILNDLKTINKELKNDLDFLELCEQSVSLKGKFNLKRDFAEYEENIDQEIDNELFTPVKTLQIGESLSTYKNLKVSDGRVLSLDDFNIVSENQEINVLLGNEYKEYYSLDSVINANLHLKDINLRVVGFLEEGISLRQNGKNTVLDDYIIMPFYNIDYGSEDPQDLYYQKIWYTQKNEGLYSKEDNEAEEKIEKLNKEFNMFLEPIESNTTIEIVETL